MSVLTASESAAPAGRDPPLTALRPAAAGERFSASAGERARPPAF